MSFSDDTTAASGLFDGRYRILRRLGSGGMARVFLAEDADLHRQVAIKVLSDRYAEDAQFVERFAREARAAAGLNHPNIVAIYDRGKADGSYYIAMEYLDGETLKDVIIRQGALPARRAIDVTLQILAALRFAHRRDVIHRDVKPHNIMVLRDGRVKVTDFGIARAGDSEMTEAGSIVGTAQYLSPEQARGLSVGPESDLYSVGVVLYEMLTGRVPFTGDSAVAIAMKHVQEQPVPPRQIEPSIPADLEQVVQRAMAKDPQRRYRSADELGMDLDRVRKGLGVTSATAALAAEDAYAQTTVQPGRTVVAPPPLPERHESTGPPPRKAWPWIVVVLLVIAVAGLGAYLFGSLGDSGGSGTDTTTPTTVAQVAVQAVLGFDQAAAQSQLENQGLKVEFARPEFSDKPEGTIINQDPASGTLVAAGATITLTLSKGVELIDVPNVVQKTYDNAAPLLKGDGFKVKRKDVSDETIPAGQVIAQDPPAGTKAPRGSTVTLTVSKGKPRGTVPNVVGLSDRDARAAIEGAGFVVAVTTDTSATVADGKVISQSPAENKKLAKGETVSIVVSTGPPPVTVPPLVGLTQAEAEAKLGDLGLNVEIVPVVVADPTQEGLVQESDPAEGGSVPDGGTVTLKIGQLGGP